MNFKKFLGILGLVCLVGLVPIQSLGQQKLAYNLKKDDFFKIKQEAKQLITQELEGAKHELTNDLEAIFSFNVVGETESIYTIEMAFEDFGMKTTSNLQGVLIDVKASEPEAGNMMSEIFSGLIGHKLQMTMQKDGKIIEVSGGNELVENMITKAGITDDFNKNLMRKSLSKEFSSVGLAKSFEQMTYFYPSNPISVGDTWNNEFSGKLNAKNSWKLEESGSEGSSISGTASITVDTEENGTIMTLAGNQQTSITTNASNGFIRTITSESLAEGISKVTNLGDVEIPTSIKSTITYELIQ
ncbi:DUF6263 family protein [Flagellimonas meridianipacifica]|uniref:Uncharacterized protein n=1 Tax=Flagellimonas meridianipacifica TaxID=1080225 RepID=A0A2T0MA88_9FLAO|nr:DUF6263 family protein [Allomuricauda pacifica]PRX54375.1 hypothetical protein CLV81_2775 [Allomuricauda pacifica]